jgi:hypothetical protein
VELGDLALGRTLSAIAGFALLVPIAARSQGTQSNGNDFIIAYGAALGPARHPDLAARRPGEHAAGRDRGS